jgi:hypothetical protein
MTRKEKESLNKHLDAVLPKYVVYMPDSNVNEATWMVSDVKAALGDFIEEEKTHACRPNYEAEYARLMDEHKKLCAELEFNRKEAARYGTENQKLRTIIKTLEFACGRSLNEYGLDV